MAEKKQKPARYVITGLLVGPFKAGDEVTAEEIEAAGLSVPHLIRVGQLDQAGGSVPADPAAPTPAEEA